MSQPTADHHGDALPPSTSQPMRERTRHGARCGSVFTFQDTGGRRSVVCPTCRPAHRAAFAAQRMRRYRQRRRDALQADHEHRQQQASYQAHRLLAEHPAVVERLLTRLSPEVADLVIDELLRQRIGPSR